MKTILLDRSASPGDVIGLVTNLPGEATPGVYLYVPQADQLGFASSRISHKDLAVLMGTTIHESMGGLYWGTRSGRLVTDEMSGHTGDNWTEDSRATMSALLIHLKLEFVHMRR